MRLARPSVADAGGKCAVRRNAKAPRRREAQDRALHLVPLKQQEFSAEAWPKSRGHSVFTGLEGTLLQPFLENKENRGAGEIADVTQDVPRRLGITFAKAQFLFYIAE